MKSSLTKTEPPPMLSNLQHNSITGLAFVLLLMSVFAHIWFASTPLPLGGPNVILAGLTVFLSLSGVLLRTVEKRSKRLGASATGLSTLVEDYGLIVPVIAVSLLLFLWMLAVYLFTGTLDSVRLAQMVLGVGVLFAVYTCVDSVHRAKLMLMAVIAATFVSALWGFAVAFIGNPFLTIWLHIATVREHDLSTLSEGRMTGLIPITGIFAYQLVVAIPPAFAAILCNSFSRSGFAETIGAPAAGRGKLSWRTCSSAVLFVVLMTMITALIMNASRSAIFGLLLTAVIILPSLMVSRFRRRLLVVVPLMAIWLLAVFDSPLTVRDISRSVRGLFADGEGPPPAISELISSDGHPLIGHTVEGLTPAKKFSAQVRLANGGPEIGPTVVAVTRDDGSLTLTWRKPDGHTRLSQYRFRLRPDGESKWGPWLDFCFSPPRCSYMSGEGPLIHDLAVGAANDDRTISHTIEGLASGVMYRAQIRASNEHGFGAQSEIAGAAADDGSLVLTWREPAASESIATYQLRLREDGRSKWRPWRDFVPAMSSVYATPPPLLMKVCVGAHTLVNRSDGPSIGCEMTLSSDRMYRVQLRTRNDHAFGIETELVVKPADDGVLVLTWLEPSDPENITTYQFRVRPLGESEWRPWRDFTPVLRSGQRLGFGNVELFDRPMGMNTSRVFDVSDWSAQSRIHMARTALQYALDYPLGTGTYRPDESHIVGNLNSRSVAYILKRQPHNQFLYMLVLFGFPGMVLLLLFYFFVLRSLMYSARFILRSQDAELYFLLIAVGGGLAAYSLVSLTAPLGPLITDWSHCFIIGLVFSIERIVASHEPPRP